VLERVLEVLSFPPWKASSCWDACFDEKSELTQRSISLKSLR